jgi:thymidylate synthase
MFFQCFVDADNRLSLHMVQRSCDMFLGVPFNIASYAILTHMLAQVSGLKPGELILTLNDAHIYEDHLEAVKEQLSRSPMTLPSLWLNPDIKNLDDFKPQDFRLDNYQHHPPIKAKMAV